MMEAIVAILGAIWRRVDGGENKPNGWHLLPALYIAWLVFQGELYLAGAFTVAWVALLDGFHNWRDFGYMSMRYTGYAALACALFDISNWYILCGFISGILYPLGHQVFLRYRWLQYTVYCELIAGGLMLGGVVYLI